MNVGIQRCRLVIAGLASLRLGLHKVPKDRQFYINPITLTIYQYTTTHIQVYSPCKTTRTLLTYKPTSHTTYRPPLTYPIDCESSPQQSTNITILKTDIPMIPRHHPTIINNFKDYLRTLDTWEQHLLEYFNCGNILATLSGPIVLASDGSVSDSSGSFGWVAATPTNHILATGYGIAYGLNITSFRSEAYGFLAALRFLYQAQCYYKIPLPNRNITWYCDSDSLIKRIRSNLNDINNPNRYKLADNDLEVAIIHTIPLVSTSLHPQHIRSHQHDHIPLHQLPLPQRLNRMADELASQAHTFAPPNTSHVPLITTARCQLNLHNGTITRSYKTTLHNAFTHHHTCKHICRRLHITQTTMDTIAWTEFSRAFRSLPTGNQRIIRRWIFGFLPTQRRLARYQIRPSPACPICKQHAETDIHFLICGGSQSWKESLFSPIEHICWKYNLHHSQERILTSSLSSFLNGHTPSTSIQTQLGWFATFYGIFSHAWVYSIHDDPSTGSTVLTSIIKTILAAVSTRWKMRCNKLHQTQHTKPELRVRLEHQIRALYSCHQDVLKQDRSIFSLPLTQLLEQSNSTLSAFIKQYKHIIKRSIKLQQEQTRRQHKDISTYFIRIREPRGSH